MIPSLDGVKFWYNHLLSSSAKKIQDLVPFLFISGAVHGGLVDDDNGSDSNIFRVKLLAEEILQPQKDTRRDRP